MPARVMHCVNIWAHSCDERANCERFEADSPPHVALVVGSEGSGVSAAARATCERAVGIPMRAGVDSVNVATAAAIALHRLTRAALDPPH